jgi:hypothetical protein
MTIETDRDFKTLATMSVPVKRAAYSDRTAWIMALLAELAYEPLDEESDDKLLALAEELAKVTDKQEIADRLTSFRNTLARLAQSKSDESASNERLKAALLVGGFELAGDRPLHSAATDTQGFVACKKRDEHGIGMAVIAFRGTKQVKDWMTNLEIAATPITDPVTGASVGNMHAGFHDAYMSVHVDIKARLEGYEDLPLYITGHSLGGALAVTATWYQSSARLAACYTFGAPRVGDQGLIDRFKTPIYRIVNGPDPVPFVPPSGVAIDAGKVVLRVIGSILPMLDAIEWLTDRLIRIQRFRHYGYMRYLSVADPGPKGDYPTLRLEFSLSSLQRLYRFIGLYSAGKPKRIDKYHDMSLYREKLKAHALKRNPTSTQ